VYICENLCSILNKYL